jgi:hypothetical protein
LLCRAAIAAVEIDKRPDLLPREVTAPLDGF